MDKGGRDEVRETVLKFGLFVMLISLQCDDSTSCLLESLLCSGKHSVGDGGALRESCHLLTNADS